MKVLRIIVALVLGVVVGSGVNMALVVLGPSVIAPPAGADTSTVEAFAQSISLFQPKHFLFPFLAHALGTFVGALVAFFVAERSKALMALVVGIFFFAGGVAASYMIPAPAWFIALDLLVAYAPMAMLAVWLGRRMQGDAG